MKYINRRKMDYVKNALASSYNFLIMKPLWKLYLDSPSLGFFGGWYGKTESDICTTITGVPAIHWETTGDEECRNLIIRRFDSFISTGTNALHLLLIFTVLMDFVAMVRWTIKYTFCTRFLSVADGDVWDRTLWNKNSKP